MYDEDIKPEQQGDNTPAWMLTFADLVSLLICFFVLLYSMKSVDETIWQKISGSFAGALNYSQKFKQVNPNNDSSSESEMILNSDSMGYIESVLYTKLEKGGLVDMVSFYHHPDTSALHIQILGDLMFTDKSTQISDQGQQLLDFITETIQYLSNTIEIASYVEPDAQGLAMQKSMMHGLAVKEYIERKGNNKQIKVLGFGSKKYEELQSVLAPHELRKKTVKLDFIIKSK